MEGSAQRRAGGLPDPEAAHLRAHVPAVHEHHGPSTRLEARSSLQRVPQGSDLSPPLLPRHEVSPCEESGGFHPEELQELLKKRKSELEKKTASPSQDVMSHLLANGDENGKLMPEAEIMNNMSTLLFAGHDLSTSKLMLIIKCLGELPHVLAKVAAEGNRSRKGTRRVASVERFTENEILMERRLRGHEDDSTDTLFVSLYWNAALTDRDPDYYPRTMSFDKSRFEGSGPAPYTYVLFGGGPRMCLGKEFARVEILVFLHNLVYKFHWDLAIPNEKIMYGPVPDPAGGLPIHLRSHEISI
ncbi:hypothetical protein NL676_031533 [Syzygium grande]|nr:hypothetical protein NL676_031533 [Syzygium grande]